MNNTDNQLLEALHEQIKKCTRCQELAGARNNVVPGEGNPTADIMFVGEAPGKDEDLQGRPFVGQAGQILTTLLEKVGLSRDEVFIGNVLKCRPPGNRDPLDHEIENCREYLHGQITLIRPKLICTLGNPSLKTLIDKSMTIGKVHGQIITRYGLDFFPIYHPAASLHNPGLRPALVKDFEALKEHLKR